MSTAQSGLWLGPGLQGVRLGFESQRLLKKSGMVEPRACCGEPTVWQVAVGLNLELRASGFETYGNRSTRLGQVNIPHLGGC